MLKIKREETPPCCKASVSSPEPWAPPFDPLLPFLRPFGLGAVRLMCDMLAAKKRLLHFLVSLLMTMHTLITLYFPKFST